jgi:hypothetical protein
MCKNFHFNALRYPKEHHFALRLPGFVHHPDIDSIKMGMSMDYWWNDTDRGKPKYSEINCAITTLPTINLERTGPGSNQDLRGERSVTNRISHGTADLENGS